MVRTCVIAAASTAVLTLSAPVFAQRQLGTADEAKAMLLKAVAAVKADKIQSAGYVQQGGRRISRPRSISILL
jgi:hypothetical protein